MKLVVPVVALPALVKAFGEEQIISGIHDVICNAGVDSATICKFFNIQDTSQCETIWSGITLAEFCEGDNNLRKKRSTRSPLDKPEKSIHEMVIENRNRGTSYNVRNKRSITTNPWSSSIIESINGYGCWCYFGSDVGYGIGGRSGGGHPKNSIDAACKDLNQGYYCMDWDFKTNAESGTCNPTDVNYISATAFSLSYDSTLSKEEAIWTACKAFNGDSSNCESRACAVEGYFLLNVFDLFLSGQSLDASLKHSLGNFDTSVCKKDTNINGSGQYGGSWTKGTTTGAICCGEYPKRYYHLERDNYNDGSQDYTKSCCAHHYGRSTLACCGGHLYTGSFYNTNEVQCCNNSLRDLNKSC